MSISTTRTPWERWTDPDQDLAYVSHYAGGFRVLSYGPTGLQKVGSDIDEDGNNFWGVQLSRALPRESARVRGVCSWRIL